MAKFTLDPNGGLLDVEVGGDKPPVRLDIYEVHNTYFALRQRLADPVEFGNALKDYLVTKGIPVATHAETFRLFDLVSMEVVEYQKKYASAGSPQPASPSSTASTVST